MGGPISDYRLGKIFHSEYEAQVSCFWAKNLGAQRGSSVIESIEFLLGRGRGSLRGAWCSIAGLGISVTGCQAGQ